MPFGFDIDRPLFGSSASKTLEKASRALDTARGKAHEYGEDIREGYYHQITTVLQDLSVMDNALHATPNLKQQEAEDFLKQIEDLDFRIMEIHNNAAAGKIAAALATSPNF